MNLTTQDMIGIGLYSVREASRLTSVPPRVIRRWLHGYAYSYRAAERLSPPVWQSQLASGAEGTIGFLDLMELRFVNAFRRSGVSLQVIRAAAERACDLFQMDHPFSRRRFATDGRRIFTDALIHAGETELMDVLTNQYAFRQIISPSLHSSVQFKHEEVVRWFPMWPKRKVVIDPSICFGRPIIKDGAVPTEVLYRSYEAEKSVKFVATIYDVPPSAVRAAIDYERKLAA